MSPLGYCESNNHIYGGTWRAENDAVYRDFEPESRDAVGECVLQGTKKNRRSLNKE